MIELLKPLESEHQQLVNERPALEQLRDDLGVQASKIDALEKAAAETLKDLERLAGA